MSPRIPGTPLMLAALVVTLVATSVGAMRASVLSWNNAAGGSISTAQNWSPPQVPTSADDLVFNLLNTYIVTYTGGATTSGTHTYKRGNVTLDLVLSHAIREGMTVGDVSGDVATATLTKGTLTSNGLVVVGDAAGSIGALEIDGLPGDDPELRTATTAGDVIIGNNGSGDLIITHGGLLSVADRFLAGSGNSAAAEISVDGISIASPFESSKLEVAGTAQASAIGAGGDVTMEVVGGGTADFAGSLNVAQGTQSTSSLFVGGSGFDPSSVTVGGDLGIGRNTAAGTVGGVGTVTVGAPATLTVIGTTHVGNDPDGGAGLLVLEDDAIITTGSLAVGAGGLLDLQGGTLTVDGGTLTHGNLAAGLSVSGLGDPLLNLVNGAAATLGVGDDGRALTLGGGAGLERGDLLVLSGSSLEVGSGDVVLGDDSDDDGRLEVKEAGSSLTVVATEEFVVGRDGDALFSARSHADAVVGDLLIARGSTSTATTLIETGATLDARNIYVGGSTTAPGGNGTLFVGTGSVCTASGPGGGEVRIWHTGSLDLRGTLFADTVTVGGAGVLTEGTIEADRCNVDVEFVASGVIDAQVFVRAAIAKLTAQGDLTLGREDGVGFINFGTLDCADHTVTALSAFRSGLGEVRLDGGTLVVPHGGHVNSSDELSGTGTVIGDIDLDGAIVATADGLRFAGVVESVGQEIGGTKIEFVDGGGFLGAGVIDAQVVCDSLSSIAAMGDLALGNGSAGAVSVDGTLDADDHLVTLADPGQAALSGQTLLSGGTIRVNTPGILAVGEGSVEGFGLLDARTFLDGGTITATGPLTIGRSGESDGFTGRRGELLVGAHAVKLLDSNGAEVPTITSLAGGTLTCASGFVLDDSKSLQGSGTCQGNVESAGEIEPGGPGALGALVVNGDLATSGVFAVEIGEAGAAARDADGGDAARASVLADLVAVSGEAALSGTLRIAALPGLETVDGDRFPILECGTRTGEFTTVEFEDPVLDLIFEIAYTPTSVELVARVTTDVPDGPIDGGDSGTPVVPAEFALRITSGNPSARGESIAIEYDVPVDGPAVSLVVYDANGRVVSGLVEGVRSAGRHSLEWGGQRTPDLASGVYFLRMDTRDFRTTRRLVLLR